MRRWRIFGGVMAAALALWAGGGAPAQARYYVRSVLPLSDWADIPEPADGATELLPPVAVNPVTHRAYVPDGGKTYVVDGPGNAVIATLPFGGPTAVNAATNRVIVAGAASVTVLNGATDETLDTLPLTGAPVAVAVDEGANRFFVLAKKGCADAVSCAAALMVFDGKDDTLLSTLDLDMAPFSLGVNATTHRVYVGGNRTIKKPGAPEMVRNAIFVADGTKRQVVDTIDFTEGFDPFFLAVQPLSNRVYAVRLGAIDVFDGATDKFVTRPTYIFTAQTRAVSPAFGISFDAGRNQLVVTGDYVAADSHGYVEEGYEALVFRGPDLILDQRIAGYGRIAACGGEVAAGRLFLFNGRTRRLSRVEDGAVFDAKPPAVTVTSDPPFNALGWVRADAATVTVHAADPPGGLGIQAVYLSVADRFAPYPVYGVTYGDTVVVPVASVKAGPYSTVAYKVRDEAGNETADTVTIHYDLSAPVTTVSLGNLPTGERQAILSAVDPPTQVGTTEFLPPSGVAGTWYRLDDGAFAAYTGPVTVPDDRAHVLQYYSQDVAGYVEAIQTAAVTLSGDVDGNGQRDVTDVVLVLKAALNLVALSPEQIAVADVNGDGGIDVVDAVWILQKIAGIL